MRQGEEDEYLFGDDDHDDDPEEEEVDHLAELTALGWHRAETSFISRRLPKTPGKRTRSPATALRGRHLQRTQMVVRRHREPDPPGLHRR
jgi:hypothetical protein